jgi:hypothetical protein
MIQHQEQTMNDLDQIELNIEALDQVSGGHGRRCAHHQAGNSESTQQQPAQQAQPVDDLTAIIAGARIKF